VITSSNNDIIVKTLENKKLRIDKRIIIFLFFVLLSSVLWFLNQLEKEYETSISIPVRYTNIPKNKILSGELTKTFNLRIKARGYKIIEYKIGNKFLPLVIDVNSLNLRIFSKGKTTKFFTFSQILKEQINQQIGYELRVLDIDPDTLFFDFARVVSKKVPVVSRLNAMTGKQYMLKGKAEIIPDSIVISGAYPLIDTIQNVYTEKINIENIEKDIEKELDIIEIQNVDFSEDEANVTIRVEKFTEGTQNVALKVVNVPDSLVLRTFPNEINVIYFVGLSDYEKVFPQLFDFIVDFNDINPTSNRLNIKLIRYPEYLQSVRYNPNTVEYIIEKK